MKRYLLFTFDTYYPRGGWSNQQATSDSIEELMAHQETLSDDHYQIVDLTTGLEVRFG